MTKIAALVLPALLAALIYRLLHEFSSRSALAKLQSESVPLGDDRIVNLARRLAAGAGAPKLIVRIHETGQVNGFVAPDGTIYLTRGLHDLWRKRRFSSEEIASVIAHEIGHVANGDLRKRFAVSAGRNAARYAAAILLARFVPGIIGGLIADLLLFLAVQRLSRSQEYAADEYAAALLLKAGIGTAPLKSLLAKLGRLPGSQGAAEWMLSHPAAEDRIKAIERFEARISRRRIA